MLQMYCMVKDVCGKSLSRREAGGHHRNLYCKVRRQKEKKKEEERVWGGEEGKGNGQTVNTWAWFAGSELSLRG